MILQELGSDYSLIYESSQRDFLPELGKEVELSLEDTHLRFRVACIEVCEKGENLEISLRLERSEKCQNSPPM